MLEIREHVSLAPLTTFEIGGLARYLVDVSSEDDIREALAWAREKNVQFYIIAGGSNLLIPDDGLDGLVIRIVGEKFSISETILEAEAGCNLLSLIRASAEAGLSGWENMAGIPGSIGGAVRGNAGAFGTEIKDVLVSARAMNTETEEVHEFSNAECQFDYRMSYFKKNPQWIVTHVHIKLTQGDTLLTRQKIEETIAERERRHIQNVRAAGSYFMNPVVSPEVREMFEKEKGVASRGGRVPAGWLIEKAGMKGVHVEGACASVQHPNYLVNRDKATAENVRELATRIKKEVREKLHTELQEEAVIL